MWESLVASAAAVAIILAIVAMLKSAAKREGAAEAETLQASQRKERREARDKILAEQVADEEAWIDIALERGRLRQPPPDEL